MTKKIYHIQYTGVSHDYRIVWPHEPYAFTLKLSAPVVTLPDGTQELTLQGAVRWDKVNPEHYEDFEKALPRCGIIPASEYKGFKGFKIGYFSITTEEDKSAPILPLKDVEQLAEALDEQTKNNLKPDVSNMVIVSSDGTASVHTSGDNKALVTVVKPGEDVQTVLTETRQAGVPTGSRYH